MPKYFEFVFAAYAIWVVSFAVYFVHLFLKSRRAERALKSLAGSGGESAGDSAEQSAGSA